jgi:hypothetical protein
MSAVDAESESKDWQAMGSHRYRIHDGVFAIRTQGVFSVEDTHLLLDQMVLMQSQQDACGVLLNVSDGLEVPPQTRKALAQRSDNGYTPLPLAVVGASLPVRAVLTLVLNAIRLLLRKDVATVFLKSEAEAITWLQPRMLARAELMRQKRQSAASSS